MSNYFRVLLKRMQPSRYLRKSRPDIFTAVLLSGNRRMPSQAWKAKIKCGVTSMKSGLLVLGFAFMAACEAAPVAQDKPVILNQTIEGHLGVRWQRNIDYLRRLHQTHRDIMLKPFQTREARYERVKDWDGEYAGKWLDAAVRIPENAAPDLRRNVEEFAEALRAAQDSDGYLGIDSREQRGKRKGWVWDVWNQWCVLTGLLTHYEQTQDRRSLEAANRGARWLLQTYGVVDSPDHRFYQASHKGGSSVDVIDQLVRLHTMAPDPALIRFAQSVVNHFPEVSTMRTTGKAVLVHPYVLFAYLGGIVDLARFGGEQMDITWLKSVADDIVHNHLYPTGSVGHKERLKASAPNDEADGPHQETCATVEWLLLNERLYRSTEDVRYVNLMEDSIYNALLAAQSENEGKWTYLTPLRYQKEFGTINLPTKCCYWSGPRGISKLTEYVYSTEPGGVRVDLFERGGTTVRFGDSIVQLRQQTAFPAEGKVLVEIRADKPVEFVVAVRVPGWMRGLVVEVNGKVLKSAAGPDGYVRIRRRWSKDAVNVTFEIPATLRKLRTYGSAVVRGPEVLSVDARDNGALDLDAVVLPTRIVLSPIAQEESGRRRYLARVAVAGEPRDVIFTPYADAGNYGARFRTVFPVEP